MNYPHCGPALDVYLRSQKVNLNFQDTTAHEFYNKFSFLNIRDTVNAPTGSDPTYMARVAQCVFEQIWFEAQVATVIGHLAYRLDLKRATYHWKFTRVGETNWNPEFTLTGLMNDRPPEYEDEEPPQSEVKLVHVIPEQVASNTGRSMRPWVDHIVAQFHLSRACESLEQQRAEADKSLAVWAAHTAEHKH